MVSLLRETDEVEDVRFSPSSPRSVFSLEEHAANLFVVDLLGAIGIRTFLVGLQAAQVRCCLPGPVSDRSETGSPFLTILMARSVARARSLAALADPQLAQSAADPPKSNVKISCSRFKIRAWATPSDSETAIKCERRRRPKLSAESCRWQPLMA